MVLKKIKYDRPLLAIILVIILSGSIGTSALLETFGSFTSETEIERSIFLDGDYGEMEMMDIDGKIHAGEVMMDTHYIENRGENTANLSVSSTCMMGRDTDPVSGTNSFDIRWTVDAGETSGPCNGVETRFVKYPGPTGALIEGFNSSSYECDSVLESKKDLEQTDLGGKTVCIAFPVEEDIIFDLNSTELIFKKDYSVSSTTVFNANNSSIRGLDAENCGNGIKINGENTRLSDSKISDCKKGLTVNNSDNIRIENLEVRKTDTGISVKSSEDTIINRTTVEKSGSGLNIVDSDTEISKTVVRGCNTGILDKNSGISSDNISIHDNRKNFGSESLEKSLENHNSTVESILVPPGEKFYFSTVNEFSVNLEPGNYYLETVLLPG